MTSSLTSSLTSAVTKPLKYVKSSLGGSREASPPRQASNSQPQPRGWLDSLGDDINKFFVKPNLDLPKDHASEEPCADAEEVAGEAPACELPADVQAFDRGPHVL